MFKQTLKICLGAAFLLFLTACPADKGEKIEKAVAKKIKKGEEVNVLMSTTMGDIELKLYNETPQHRDNFLTLVKKSYYDSLLFHRVIPQFMIQGGDPNSKNASPNEQLGNGGPDYTIPAEFHPDLIHKKGALAAARKGDQMNPEKASSGSQFYIVQGQVYPPQQLDKMEERINRQKFEMAVRTYLFRPENAEKLAKAQKLSQTNPDALTEYLNSFEDSISMTYSKVEYTDEQKNAYGTIGGTPHLDGDYTVFGEVVSGLEVVDKIAAVATGAANRPKEDVLILSVEIID